jgi:hypothetical protein
LGQPWPDAQRYLSLSWRAPTQPNHKPLFKPLNKMTYDDWGGANDEGEQMRERM